MKNINELETEYQEFMIKFTKAAKDLNEDIAKLSPENQQRFRQDVKKLVKLNLPNLVEFLRD